VALASPVSTQGKILAVSAMVFAAIIIIAAWDEWRS
jgi:hypothetical protein